MELAGWGTGTREKCVLVLPKAGEWSCKQKIQNKTKPPYIAKPSYL